MDHLKFIEVAIAACFFAVAILAGLVFNLRKQNQGVRSTLETLLKRLEHHPCPAPATEVALDETPERPTVFVPAPLSTRTANRMLEGAPPEAWSDPGRARVVDIQRDSKETLYLRIGNASIVSTAEREDTPTLPQGTTPRPKAGPPRR